MNLLNPETSNLRDPATIFTDLVESKFAIGTPLPSVVRQHKQSMLLAPTTQLSHCPAINRIFLERPDPEKLEATAVVQSQPFGAHCVTVFEAGEKIQTDFYPHEGQVWMRQITRKSDGYPAFTGSPLDQVVRETRERLSLLALDGAAQATAAQRENIGQPLNPDQTNELLVWLEGAIPAQQ